MSCSRSAIGTGQRKYRKRERAKQVTQYLVRRALHSVIVLAGLVVLLFFFTHVLGDTVYLMLPPESPEEAFEDLREALGLNRPLYVQFFSYIGGVLQGDFGNSIVYREVPAMDLVLERLPKSAYLGAVSWAIALIGVPLGVLAAKWPRSLYDRAVNVLSFASVSLPGFWLALMLILVVSVQWQLTPTSGFGGYTGFKYMVLPVLALVPSVIGSLALITRAAMTEEMGKPYATVARAKGLGEQAVLFVHILKNASISIVTFTGMVLVGFLNGSTIAEFIFGWPGLGLLTLEAIDARDLAIIEAATFAFAALILLANFLVDMVYCWLDPRIRYA